MWVCACLSVSVCVYSRGGSRGGGGLRGHGPPKPSDYYVT